MDLESLKDLDKNSYFKIEKNSKGMNFTAKIGEAFVEADVDRAIQKIKELTKELKEFTDKYNEV